MKVLRINTSLNHGGAALSSLNINNALIDLGIDSFMLGARGESNLESRLIGLGEGKFRRLINVAAYRVLGVEGLLNHNLWRKAIENIDEYDLIHLHNVHGYYMPHWVLEKLLLKPCVWTLHDFWICTGGPGSPPSRLKDRSKLERVFPFSNWQYPAEFFNRSNVRKKYIQKLISEYKPELVAISNEMAKRLIDLGLYGCSVNVIPHGFFNSELPPSEHDRVESKVKRGMPLNRHIFLFCSAQVDNPLKGFDIFFQSLIGLPSHFNWVAYVAGDKAELAKKKVKRFGDKFQFLGKLSEMEIRECFRACDYYITPTLDESFGRTVVEAMAEGAEVVCSDLAVLREVSDGRAMYFPVKDVSFLTSLLESSLRLSDKKNRLENAQIIRKKFSRQKMAHSYLELYYKQVREKCLEK